MEIRQVIFTENDCYKAGVKMVPTGIMVHSTGAKNPTLRRYISPDDGELGKPSTQHWNQPMETGKKVCVHGFIGKDKAGKVRTYQTLPWDMRGWHCYFGDNGSGNNTHISFEICEDGLEDAVYFGEVYEEAAQLCAHLCREFKLTEKDIICHSEGHAQGIASNHADVMHWFPKHGKSMDAFRDRVAEILSGAAPAEKPDKPAPENKRRDEKVAEIRYKQLKDIPEGEFRDTVEKLMEAKIVNGDGSDPEGHNDIIDVSHDMVRMFVTLNRAGAYDKKYRQMGLPPTLRG